MTILVDTAGICDNSAPNIYECADCGMDLEEGCNCIWDTAVDEIDVFCHACDDYHRNIDVNDLIEHNFYDDEEEEELESETMNSFAASFFGLGGKSSHTKKQKDPDFTIHYHYKCRHFNNPVEFGDGTTVYASSMHDRKAEDPSPDFGLYLDSGWKPACLAYLIDWPDYGIPKKFDKAAYAIIDVYNKARNGLWVEVGCIGGHGRTGTALACMAVLGGSNPEEAVQLVKKTYCSHAIESSDQVWFVKWFHTFIHGGTIKQDDIFHRGKWNNKLSAYEGSYTEPGPVFSYSVPFEWENYDPTANPKGRPPKKTIKLVEDQYFYTDGWDAKKQDWVTVYTEPGDQGWTAMIKKFRDQEERKKAEEEAKAAARKAIQDLELEPF